MEFQFHKGSIQTENKPIYLKLIVKFQFHKGSIQTGYDEDKKAIPVQFQFHKGSIQTHLCVAIHLCFVNFNSIKVQFKL